MAKTSRESFQQMLRLTEELRDRLRLAADQNNRTLNAEIIERLEASLGPANPTYALDPARERLKRAVAEMQEAINELEIAEML